MPCRVVPMLFNSFGLSAGDDDDEVLHSCVLFIIVFWFPIHLFFFINKIIILHHTINIIL